MTAFAQSIEGMVFSNEDWTVACDNTGTCRAIGYTPRPDTLEASEGDFRLAVLLPRAAGPNQPVQGLLSLVVWDDKDLDHRDFQFQIGNQSYGYISGEGGLFQLSSQQVQALFNAARTDDVIVFIDRHTGERGVLSGRGMSAVFLKMDEFQGRAGTIGALLDRGNQSEANVLRPQAIPVLEIPQLLQEDSQEYDELKRYYLSQDQRLLLLTQAIYDEECFADNQEALEIYPLNNEKALLSRLCWRAARDRVDAYWLVDHGLNAAQLITISTGSSYREGQIIGRTGSVECWWGEDYTWDGAQFVKTSAFGSDMCRGPLAGLWMMPTVVYEVPNGADKRDDESERP